MSNHRFFLDTQIGAEAGETIAAPLAPSDLHHAVAVLRVSAGEHVDLVDAAGVSWRARVVSARRDALEVELLEVLAPAAQPVPVTLVFGVSKGGKNDEIVERATELGAARIMPVLTERSVVKLDAEKRRERGDRWRRVARAAAEQSKRSSIPQVDDAQPLGDILDCLRGFDVVLVAWEEADVHGAGIRQALAAAADELADVAIVVGPEGGLSPVEVDTLMRVGAVPVTLGQTVLRAETAAVVAAALCVHELHGLGNS